MRCLRMASSRSMVQVSLRFNTAPRRRRSQCTAVPRSLLHSFGLMRILLAASSLSFWLTLGNSFWLAPLPLPRASQLVRRTALGPHRRDGAVRRHQKRRRGSYVFSLHSIAPGSDVPSHVSFTPLFNQTNLDSSVPTSLPTSVDILQRQVSQQQTQIEALLQLLQQQQQISRTDSMIASLLEQQQWQERSHQHLSTVVQSTKPSFARQSTVPALFQELPSTIQPASGASISTVEAIRSDSLSLQRPVKVMLFIDGTWLYYSIHERPVKDCPLIQRYGRGWQLRYDLNWTALPEVISAALSRQLGDETHLNNTLEWVRSSVYTSYKADTSPASYRYKLFQDLQASQYQVYMMETVGRSEKCVDIQLAVELLHYATSALTDNAMGDGESGAYDVALLLTGDKDFMPAMIRTRQKNKMLGLVSMRRGCNRALIDTESLCDFDVIWLEDYLDQLVVPKSDTDPKLWRGHSSPTIVSPFTLHKVITDFLTASDLPRVQSRDLGRFLKSLGIGTEGSSLLDELKQGFGGLYQFLGMSRYYMLEHDSFKEDSTDHSYWISLNDDARSILLEEAARTTFSAAEKSFFDGYTVTPLLQDRLQFYGRTLLQTDSEVETSDVALPEILTTDYGDYTAVALKQVCRDFGLTVSGTKAALLERIQSHVETQVALLKLEQNQKRATVSKRPRTLDTLVSDSVSLHLQALMLEYLRAKGGVAGSRDIGRYMNANKPSSDNSKFESALKELKYAYGSLRLFASSFPDSFCVEGNNQDFEFQVSLSGTTFAPIR